MKMTHLIYLFANRRIITGSLIGTVIDNFASKINSRNAYLIPLGIVHLIPLILTIGLFFIPESPRWLATRYASNINIPDLNLPVSSEHGESFER